MDMLDNEIQLMRRVVAVEEVGALAGFEIPARELVEAARTLSIPAASLPRQPPPERFAKPEIRSRLTRQHG